MMQQRPTQNPSAESGETANLMDAMTPEKRLEIATCILSGMLANPTITQDKSQLSTHVTSAVRLTYELSQELMNYNTKGEKITP